MVVLVVVVVVVCIRHSASEPHNKKNRMCALPPALAVDTQVSTPLIPKFLHLRVFTYPLLIPYPPHSPHPHYSTLPPTPTLTNSPTLTSLQLSHSPRRFSGELSNLKELVIERNHDLGPKSLTAPNVGTVRPIPPCLHTRPHMCAPAQLLPVSVCP